METIMQFLAALICWHKGHLVIHAKDQAGTMWVYCARCELRVVEQMMEAQDRHYQEIAALAPRDAAGG